ncbi:NADP-dependent phosphogluconate dehydrogenase [Streptomyces fuscichromogenes]|uniref:6-phosphogluconate dehydrogenase, decarboxylating n=1 Tax=Streptomyces fuscichromogenes TaxID=1324013 RepID=A0A917XGK2_9ACTN|nr:NADP-dependent phosphogluconate dehydrogenase [Streptomyces fuscichromogenes]GGN23260.1 6-phosphogluconate dehydrogenase, decarboxylating [Streptomyces fuscichromogenes]
MNDSAAANIGVIGLAVMGSNLARNLASREGNVVAVHNRTHARTEELVAAHPEAGFIAAKTIDDFVAALARPRTAIIMVQAGAGTDAVIDQLAERFEPGDIIVDGGNAHFRDTIAREQRIALTGIHFVGVGISGGEEGALRGPSIMPGGSAESYRTLGPILSSIAAVAEGEPCVTHVGTDGAGHFVKMIHNGIEYADMQLIGEAYDLLRTVGGLEPDDIADVFAQWNRGPLESYLIEITAEILRHTDPATGRPFVDVVLDQAGSKGTGVWTVQTALDLGVPVGGIAEAVFARSVSAKPEQRAAIRRIRSSRPEVQQADASFVEAVAKALFASKLVAYAQGFDAVVAGAEKYGWNIHQDEIARIWRGGCIIRARFLSHVTEAYAQNPDITTLLEAPYFAQAVAEGEDSWRRVVATAAHSGVPVPGFGSALSYYDSLGADRLPAALVQAQRDFFGAHTYRRTDRDGTFHTLWSADQSETKLRGTAG